MAGRHGRLPWYALDELDDAQRAVHTDITGGARARAGRTYALADDHGRLHGPFNAMLVNPALGDAVQRLGAAVRYGTGLTDRAREIAILEVARAARSDFEWFAHGPRGYRRRVDRGRAASLQRGDAPPSFDDGERAVHEFVAALTRSATRTTRGTRRRPRPWVSPPSWSW